MTTDDLITIAPFLAAVGVAIAIVIADLVAPGRPTPVLVVSLVGLGIVAILTLTTGNLAAAAPRTAFGDGYVVDGLTTFLDLLFVSIVAFTIVFGPDYLEPRGLPLAEFAAVLVFAMTGAMLISASADLLVLFVALELMVLPGYMLAGYHKTDGYSTEGAIKYFLLGSFSSAIFLFGLAFTWGVTGTTNIAAVSDALGSAVQAGTLAPALILGLGFMTTGVAFKIAAVPFHYWTPDAYQGSPTPVTGYLSVGPKIGAFALILRLFVDALGPLRNDWVQVVIILAVLTMTLGNLVALTQNNVKRMLAYSSIAHTGYMLVGLAAFGAGQIRPPGPAVLRGRVLVHESRRIRCGRRRPAQSGRHLEPRHVRRSDPPRAVAGDPDDPVHAVPDRDPADRRLLRQGLRDPAGRPGERGGLDLARRGRGDHGAQRGGRGVLLPARAAVHVRPRAPDGAAGPDPRAAAVGWPRGLRGAHGHPGPDPRLPRRRERGGARDRRLIEPVG